jgi:hypothetical protein
LMERQVSLQLRYYRGNSFGRDYWREENRIECYDWMSIN